MPWATAAHRAQGLGGSVAAPRQAHVQIIGYSCSSLFGRCSVENGCCGRSLPPFTLPLVKSKVTLLEMTSLYVNVSASAEVTVARAVNRRPRVEEEVGSPDREVSFGYWPPLPSSAAVPPFRSGGDPASSARDLVFSPDLPTLRYFMWCLIINRQMPSPSCLREMLTIY